MDMETESQKGNLRVLLSCYNILKKQHVELAVLYACCIAYVHSVKIVVILKSREELILPLGLNDCTRNLCNFSCQMSVPTDMPGTTGSGVLRKQNNDKSEISGCGVQPLRVARFVLRTSGRCRQFRTSFYPPGKQRNIVVIKEL